MLNEHILRYKDWSEMVSWLQSADKNSGISSTCKVTLKISLNWIGTWDNADLPFVAAAEMLLGLVNLHRMWFRLRFRFWLRFRFRLWIRQRLRKASTVALVPVASAQSCLTGVRVAVPLANLK